MKEKLTEQNKNIVHGFYDAWNKRDTLTMQKFYSSSLKYYNPAAGSEPVLFEDAIRQIKMLWVAFPDLSIEVKDLFAENDKVFVRFDSRGTQKQSFGGIPARGVTANVGAMQVFLIKDNMIAETWEISDRLGLLQQLGMELQMKKNP
jgi:steroid delta-isomerase-like uncharacterized protein